MHIHAHKIALSHREVRLCLRRFAWNRSQSLKPQRGSSRGGVFGVIFVRKMGTAFRGGESQTLVGSTLQGGCRICAGLRRSDCAHGRLRTWETTGAQRPLGAPGINLGGLQARFSLAT